MTAAENVLRGNGYGSLGEGLVQKGIEAGTGYVTKLFKNFARDLFSYDVSSDEGFRQVGVYEGRPVYAGSNEQIGALLDAHGSPGHKRGAVNYGAAFRGKIYVNDQLLYGAAEAGVADPLASRKLKYVLDHELAHLNGAEEAGAHKTAQLKTGLTIANIGGFI